MAPWIYAYRRVVLVLAQTHWRLLTVLVLIAAVATQAWRFLWLMSDIAAANSLWLTIGQLAVFIAGAYLLLVLTFIICDMWYHRRLGWIDREYELAVLGLSVTYVLIAETITHV